MVGNPIEIWNAVERVQTHCNTHAYARTQGDIAHNRKARVPSRAKPETIVLTIQPLASDRPVEIRLRWVLKKILREQQFRCVRVADVPSTDPLKTGDVPVSGNGNTEKIRRNKTLSTMRTTSATNEDHHGR